MKEDRFWFHWQNLNIDKFGRKKNPLKYGRCWWHFGYRKSIGFEWHFGKIRFSLGVTYGDCENELVFTFSLPLISLYLTFDGIFAKLRQKERKHTGISIHDGSVWIDIGRDEWSYNPRTDKFRHIVITPMDIMFGSMKHSKQDLKKKEVKIPMPEGAYPATVTLFESTWKRPRLPFKKKMVRAEIEVEKGIPIPGKGENAWDCGDDAIYSLTTSANSIEDAVAAMVKSCLNTRNRYGGDLWEPSVKSNA